MGKDRLVHRKISPLTTITNLTPQNVTDRAVGLLGNLPIGVYKGTAAFWDLDKANNQPLVSAEKLYHGGVLDGREEDYDLQTLAVTIGEAIGTPHRAIFTVPTGVVWYINAIESVIPASGGANIIDVNWRCIMWTDRAAVPSADGQAFHAANINLGVGGGTQWDEFGVIPLLWSALNKPETLRLPSGTVIAVTFTNTIAVAAATVNCLCRLYGYIGKTLVV